MPTPEKSKSVELGNRMLQQLIYKNGRRRGTNHELLDATVMLATHVIYNSADDKGRGLRLLFEQFCAGLEEYVCEHDRKPSFTIRSIPNCVSPTNTSTSSISFQSTRWGVHQPPLLFLAISSFPPTDKEPSPPQRIHPFPQITF